MQNLMNIVNRNSMTHFTLFFIVCSECHVVWANFELLDGRYLSLMYQIMTWTPPLPLISFVSRVWNFLIIRWIVLELHNFFPTFPECFYIPIFFSNLQFNCSNLWDMINLQEQVKKAFCYQKLFWPFTAWMNCPSDLKKLATS